MSPEHFYREARHIPLERFAVLERLFECWATPREFHEAPERLIALGHHEAAQLLRRGKTWRHLQQSRAIREFTRTDLSADATLYQSAALATSPPVRRLVVAFAARGGRLTLPACAFLQALPQPGTDVLLLRDRHKLQFRLGCHGLADNFRELLRAIEQIAATYPQVIALGTSMGGLPAIRTGLMLGLPRAISLGGRFWNDIARINTAARLPVYDPLCACRAPSSCHFVFASASGHTADTLSARQLATVFGGSAFAVPHLNSHHILGEAWLTNQLPPLLSELLDVPGPMSAPEVRGPL